ncbi:MAG: NUDIX domain-containing protein [Dehalococcoidia bacterium]
MKEHHRHEAVYRFCVRCAGELAPRVVKRGEPERLVCQRCEYVHYLDPKVSAGTILVTDGKMVLVQRGTEPSYGKWVFPGGFVDRGETLEQAAIREAKEEVGVDVSIDGLVGAYSYEGSPVIIIVYAATITGGELRPLDEVLDLRLFLRDEIPWHDLAFPSTRDALLDYCQQFWPE